MNAVYPHAVTAFERGEIDVLGDNIVVQLLGPGYTYNPTHGFLDIIDAGDRLGGPVTLTGKGVVDGGFLAADTIVPAVPAGPDDIVALVLYQNTGSEATSRLLVFLDRGADTVPIRRTPNGGNIALTWSTHDPIFRL